MGLCTVGDIHGDLHKGIAALKVAGVLAEDGNNRPLWVGGDTYVVQLGDVLDRGDCEIGEWLLHAHLSIYHTWPLAPSALERLATLAHMWMVPHIPVPMLRRCQ